MGALAEWGTAPRRLTGVLRHLAFSRERVIHDYQRDLTPHADDTLAAHARTLLSLGPPDGGW
ncbi:hypothetical protein HNP84_006941 [Thermocatellispora tengchongensis]|uniref:Uncharacterized protein n=1 Tax=Thermocatellispora tengchongensis TaxID=1073253 RepID=A0A840PDX4_9ACTN|nr:hypothetical protein [Thermocatellispora tengchongensis]MBB5137189.1 hypothetical protein [Thermocatellispora tengchongensis]